MAFWGVRAERSDLDAGLVGMSWPALPDLRLFATWDRLSEFIDRLPGSAKPAQLRQHAAQIWSFAHEILPGDLVAVVQNNSATLQLAEATGAYHCIQEPGRDPVHLHEVRCLLRAMPHSALEPDLRHSLRSLAYVRRIRCEAAEERCRALVARSRFVAPRAQSRRATASLGSDKAAILEPGRDAIRGLLRSTYWGARCEVLVQSVLEAEGYHVLSGGPGADGGIDLMAGSGPMGFGVERLAVQIKAGRRPVTGIDLAAFEASMARCGVQTGLVVSLAGFAGLNLRVASRGGFRIRLWDEEALLDAVLKVYDRMPDEVRRDLPLKRVWVPDWREARLETQGTP